MFILKSKRILCFALVALFIMNLALPVYADTGTLSPWEVINSTTSIPLGSLYYCDGQFVSASYSSKNTGQNYFLTSPDGVIWNNNNVAGGCMLTDLAYGNGIYVEVGSEIGPAPPMSPGTLNAPTVSYTGGVILTSANGRSWTSVPGIEDMALASAKGQTWTPDSSSPCNIWSVTFENGIFLAVGNMGIENSHNCHDALVFFTSTDGKTWTASSTNIVDDITDICYGNGLFVAMGQESYDMVTNQPASSYILTSPDGKNWTSQNIDITSQNKNTLTTGGFTCVTYGNGLFVAVGTINPPSQGIIATSTDGSTWTVQTPVPDTDIHEVVYGDGFFMAVAENENPARGTLGEIMTSPDGINWTSQMEFPDKSSPQGDFSSPSFGGAVFGNNSFFVIASSGALLEATVTPNSTTATNQTAAAPTPATATAPTSTASASTVVSPSNGQQAISFIIGQSSYTVGGTSSPMDGAPFVSNGRTLVPVRYLADALGAQTAWDAATQTITITSGSTTVELVIGSTAIATNGTVNQMDVAPVVENGRTYLPARYIAQAFGNTVSWDAATQTINITE